VVIQHTQAVARVRDVIWKEGKLILRPVQTFSYLSQKTRTRKINWRRRENVRWITWKKRRRGKWGQDKTWDKKKRKNYRPHRMMVGLAEQTSPTQSVHCEKRFLLQYIVPRM